jgi:superfamily II DNA helicase RecQ
MLLAIDELHLCAPNSWGGTFRPTLSVIHKLHDQLPDSVLLLSTTATLTTKNWVILQKSTGFKAIQPYRTPIYREDIFLHITPLNNYTNMVKHIVRSLLAAGAARRPAKAIFFTDKKVGTVRLKDDITQ